MQGKLGVVADKEQEIERLDNLVSRISVKLNDTELFLFFYGSKDMIKEKQEYLPSKFECIACGLKIAGLSHLSAAGLGDIYVQTSFYTPSEFYELEDPADYWEDDNNERF